MKSLIFLLCIFYSLLLNAQTVSGEEDSHSVSQHKHIKQSENTEEAAKGTSNGESDADAVTSHESSAENTTKRSAAEDSSTTPNETAKAESHFGLSIDTIDTSVELGLEYPLSFGAHGKFHLNESIYTRLGVGFTSQFFFVGAFTRVAPGLGYLNQQEAQLIGDTIENSLLGSLRFGWLPYTKKVGGPYIELGLLGFAFGRGETSGEALNEAIGASLNKGGKNRYSVKSDILSGTFHIGYQVPIEKHIHLNIELGIIKILYVQIKENKKRKVDFLEEKHHEEFKQFLTEKGWIFPTLSAWIGFSF